MKNREQILASYRVQPDPLRATLIIGAAAAVCASFAVFAPHEVFVMLWVFFGFIAFAMIPARLIVGCDGLVVSRVDSEIYVSFAEVVRITRMQRGVRIERRHGRALLVLTYGVSVAAADVAREILSRFEAWSQVPDPIPSSGAPFRSDGRDDFVGQALNPRLSGPQREQALQHLDAALTPDTVERLLATGDAFADPSVKRRLQRLRPRAGGKES
jgi:hypothetical protein